MTPPKFPGAVAPAPIEEGKQPPWLMSFADFVSCLLACFVLLFSMVSLNREQLLRILGNVPGRQYVEQQAPQPVERGMIPDSTTPARDVSYLLALLRESFAKDPVLAKLPLAGEAGLVRISLPTDTLLGELRAGTAAKPGGLLYAIAGSLRAFPNEIVLQGGGASASDPERWGNLLLLTQMTALALEQGGVAGPVLARTSLGGDGGLQVEIVITERTAAETAR
jgi:Membrane MotB of proton-channel complex MotA/MotB